MLGGERARACPIREQLSYHREPAAGSRATALDGGRTIKAERRTRKGEGKYESRCSQITEALGAGPLVSLK